MNRLKQYLKYTDSLTALTGSFLCTFAVSRVCRLGAGNLFTLLFFSGFLLFFVYTGQKLKESSLSLRIRICSLIPALIFSTMYLLVEGTAYVAEFSSTLFRTIVLVLAFAGFVCLFYRTILLLLLFLDRFSSEQSLYLRLFEKADREDCTKGRICRPSLYAFFTCILFWLPHYLFAFPGIMTPDTINQFEQLLGVIPYSNHHPLPHTLFMKICYDIGFFFTQNRIFATGFCTLVQLFLLSFCVAYLINTLKHMHFRNYVLIAVTCFYALIPYHAVLASTLWKDIPFAAAVLLFTCSLFRLTYPRYSYGAADAVLFILSGMMVCLFRSNGWYALLLCLPVFVICYRRQWKKIYPLLGIIFVSVTLIKYPLMKQLQIESGDFIESMCIPMQQITAVICNDRPLTGDQRELIENVVDLTYIKELYCPNFADNIKELVRAGNQDYLIAHKKEFLKLYITLGIKYPADYIKAYVDQTYGYWFPDYIQPAANLEGVVPNNLGIHHAPLLSGMLFFKFKEISLKLGEFLPVYGVLWSMGSAFWIMIVCMASAFAGKNRTKLLLYLPGFALVLSILVATPVATEFRYVYFLEYTLPFYVLLCFSSGKNI